jgi:manganese transport protein
MWLAQPDIAALLRGFIPSSEIVTNKEMLFVAMGILGATVMPHNLYLHSGIVQTRDIGRSDGDKRDAIRLATFDSTLALATALFVNASILILAAAAFHAHGNTQIAELGSAYAACPAARPRLRRPCSLALACA